MIHVILSNSLNPPYPSPPGKGTIIERVGCGDITWKTEERGMTGFIISRELIALGYLSSPLIPHAARA